MRLRDGVSKSNVLLVILGCIVLTLYRVGLAANNPGDIRWLINLVLVQSAVYLLAVWIVIRIRPSRVTLFIAIAFALLFRLSILFSPPYLSDDVYRYIWDGRVQAAGINPYRYVPAAPELAHLRDDNIYPKINRRDHAHTIYPPLAEGLFLATTRISESVVWMKLTMLGFEVIAVWAIAQLLTSLGLPRQRLLIYAWHPLVIWEFAGSGHVDAIAIAFIALALLAFHRKPGIAAGSALACATLTKLFPIVLLPAFFKPRRWIIPAGFAATMLLAYLPYLSVGPTALLGYLPGYAQEQGLISGEQFYLLNLARKFFGANVPFGVFVGFAAIVMGGIACWAILRKTGSLEQLRLAMVLATATTVLFAPHYSWYFAWLVPFLCFTPSAAVFYLTIASFVLYFTWLGDSPDQMLIINSIVYLPLLLIGAIEFFFRREERATKEHEIAFS
jgi:hypothetical protein